MMSDLKPGCRLRFWINLNPPSLKKDEKQISVFHCFVSW